MILDKYFGMILKLILEVIKLIMLKINKIHNPNPLDTKTVFSALHLVKSIYLFDDPIFYLTSVFIVALVNFSKSGPYVPGPKCL